MHASESHLGNNITKSYIASFAQEYSDQFEAINDEGMPLSCDTPLKHASLAVAASTFGTKVLKTWG
ncbi:hypothetical protein HanPSC8_Chr04g0158411 [Helianthus annuus]|nr:hypothetical protein HanPSC8_Chr04g0158411 [Helianthus annuus]